MGTGEVGRLKRVFAAAWIGFFILLSGGSLAEGQSQAERSGPYLGFDRNDYPGDSALPALRKTFRYTSYWLNNPPGERANSWAGKRTILRENGLGFLVLFTGRTDAEIKTAASAGESALQLGEQDGKAAVAAAAREGFPKNVLIFLDQEEGGRLLPEQAEYLFAWADAVRQGGARAGVYCSGIEVKDASGTTSTALEIAERESVRNTKSTGSAAHAPDGRGAPLALWIANDQCPPAPGCSMTAPRLDSGVSESLRNFATVWQYAQSPRRAQFSSNCPQNQAPDGKCYPTAQPTNSRIFVDLDTADSPDPSESSQ
jgi:hypothetical protein